MAIIARRITARPISSRRVNGRGQSLDNAVTDPWLFDFSRKMTALPLSFQKMNATYTRNSEKRVEQDGALVTLPANQFGTSYDPVTGLYGYVPEPAATNNYIESQDISGANKTGVNATGTPSYLNVATAPDGTLTADKIIEDSSTGQHRIHRFPFTSAAGTSYTFSVFVKAAERSIVALSLTDGANGTVVYFNVSTGVISAAQTSFGTGFSDGGALIRSIGGGWYRCSVTTTVASAGLSVQARTMLILSGTTTSYQGDNSSGLFVWGFQMEIGSRATSYIATTGSTATRAADVLSVPLANIPGFIDSGYTLFADGRFDVNTAASRTNLVVSDGTTNNRTFTLINTSNFVETGVSTGGSSVVVQTGLSVGATRVRVAFSCSANNFLAAQNGSALTQDTSGAMPVSPTVLNLGSNQAGANQSNAFLFRAGLIQQALTQAQINGLTT